MVLYHDGEHNELLNICDYSSKTQHMDLPPEEKTCFGNFIYKHIGMYLVFKTINPYLLVFVWVIAMEQKLFHHFSEVICIHTFSQTNKD